MSVPEVKFGEWLQRGFDSFRDHALLWVVSSLIAVVLSVLTLGVLAGPMYAGLAIIGLALDDRREPKPEIEEVFRGFNFFLPSFLFWLVWTVAILVGSWILNQIPCLGQLASVVLVFAVQAFLIFGIFLIVDRKLDFWTASTDSMNTVKLNYFPFLGFCVAVSLIASAGAVLCFVGLVVTVPIAVASLAAAYRDVYGREPGETVPAAPPAEAPAAEAPPAGGTEKSPDEDRPQDVEP